MSRRMQTGSAKIGSVVGYAATSGGSTMISFFADTLPAVQWFAALLGAFSGMIAIALGLIKLSEWAKRK